MKRLVGLALLACIGCTDRAATLDTGSDAGADMSQPTGSPCEHFGVEPAQGPTRIVGDVSGDGLADWVTATEASTTLWTGPWDSPQATELAFPISLPMFVARHGDLNDDGAQDVVIGSQWRNAAAAFFGPFTGISKPMEEAFLISREPVSTSDLLGAAVLVADLTGDGVHDLLVTAPSEGEEACSGVRPTLVYAGPIHAGVADTSDGVFPTSGSGSDTPEFVFASETFACLGHEALLRDADGDGRTDLVLLGSRTEVFELPLVENPPARQIVPEGSEPRPSDVDGDGAEDAHSTSPGMLAWTRSSDGASVTLSFNSARSQVAVVHLHDNAHALSGVWLLVESAGRAFELKRIPLDAHGELDLATLDVRASFSLEVFPAITTGDVDGNGRMDLVIGDRLLRCVG